MERIVTTYWMLVTLVLSRFIPMLLLHENAHLNSFKTCCLGSQGQATRAQRSTCSSALGKLPLRKVEDLESVYIQKALKNKAWAGGSSKILPCACEEREQQGRERTGGNPTDYIPTLLVISLDLPFSSSLALSQAEAI